MNSSISAVTIFTDRARLTRVQRVALKEGPHKVDFNELPVSLLAASLRASGQGTARAKLLGVTSRQEHFVETPAEAARDLENQILKLDDTDADLSAKASVLEKERASLDILALQNEMWARGIALRGRTIQEQGELLDFINERTNKINDQILKIGRERRELAKEKDRLQRELKGVQAARPKQRVVATVEVDVEQAGELALELSYIVTGAGWSPLYDLRLIKEVLEVSYLAQVTQNTGEDWTNVAVTLSTAQPSLSLTIPEMNPWYIQPRVEAARSFQPQAKGGLQLAMAAPAPAAPMPRAEPEAFAPLELEEEKATVSAAGASLTYTLASRADIPGHNEPRKVTIASFNLKPVFDYVTAPKIEATCFRRAKLKNESKYSLLPGTAQLFEGDNYLGATPLEFIAPNQEFELALGADERLRVERELTLREVDKTFIGDKRKIRYGYKIELENLREAPLTLLVRDHIPVAKDESLKVRLDMAEPKTVELSDLNQLEWKLTVNAGSTQTIKYEFSVEHPRSLEVVGLP